MPDLDRLMLKNLQVRRYRHIWSGVVYDALGEPYTIDRLERVESEQSRRNVAVVN